MTSDVKRCCRALEDCAWVLDKCTPVDLVMESRPRAARYMVTRLITPAVILTIGQNCARRSGLGPKRVPLPGAKRMPSPFQPGAHQRFRPSSLTREAPDKGPIITYRRFSCLQASAIRTHRERHCPTEVTDYG